MSGQPNIPGFAEFDVTDIAVTWEKDTIAGNNLAILDLGEAFDVTVTFAGKGTEWENRQKEELPYQVELYAEGIGLPPADQNLGMTKGNLVKDQNTPYKKVCKVPNGINQKGVYRLAAMVTFPHEAHMKGWLGFMEGPFIQVHEEES